MEIGVGMVTVEMSMRRGMTKRVVLLVLAIVSSTLSTSVASPARFRNGEQWPR